MLAALNLPYRDNLVHQTFMTVISTIPRSVAVTEVETAWSDII